LKPPVIGDLESDRRRSKAANAAQVTIIATYVALSYLLTNFGRGGFFIFPILFAAVLVFYDARPDLAQRIFPRLWAEKNK
jgi:4-hydroxybenzoate polyprenyltransferase